MIGKWAETVGSLLRGEKEKGEIGRRESPIRHTFQGHSQISKLFNSKKEEEPVDPKMVLCPYFKQGLC